MKPSPFQRETLRIISRLTKDKGYPPTWAEMAKALKITTSAVHDRLRVLREGGLVTWIARRARTLRVTEEGQPYAGH